MKRISLLCIAFFGLFLSTAARPINLQTAQSIAIKFMGASDVQLVSTYRTDKSVSAFYVFNTYDGFTMVKFTGQIIYIWYRNITLSVDITKLLTFFHGTKTFAKFGTTNT